MTPRPHGNDIVIGRHLDGRPVTLTREARAKHLLVVGSTGTGKSKFIEHAVWSDLIAQPGSRCGLLLLDPHGKIFDDLVARLAADNVKHLPIIPIDLRRKDLIIGYNLLRHRSNCDPAVVIAAFVRAILHAWNQSNGNETPRLEKWLTTMLRTLYHTRSTLADALHLINSRDLRKAIAHQVEDVVSRRVWEGSLVLSDSDFHQEVESTLNRLRRLISTQVMRASLCQLERSFDMSQAMESGSIVLVSTATEGTQIDEQDAKTFGNLMLSDLYTSAKSRGKRDDIRPFYLFVDEFAEFMSPTMARGLDQMRGFGIHMTLVTQQIASFADSYGDEGRAVFNSVMANARSKIVFQTDHPDDLEMLTMWAFRQQIDPDVVKHELHATKVMDHQVKYLASHSSSTSHGQSTGQTRSKMKGRSSSISKEWGHTDTKTDGRTLGTSTTRAIGIGSSTTVSYSQSEGESCHDSKSHAEAESVGHTTGHSHSSTVGYGLTSESGVTRASLLQLTDGSVTSTGEVDSLRRSDSEGDSDSNSMVRSRSDGTSSGRSFSRQRGMAHSSSESVQRSIARGKFESRSSSESSADSYGASYAKHISNGQTRSRSHTLSTSSTEGLTRSPVLMPLLGKELSSVQFRTIEEQLFRFSQYLAGQPDRHFVARFAGERFPMTLITEETPRPITTRAWTDRWVTAVIRRMSFAVPLDQALKRLGEEEDAFHGRILRSSRMSDEPECTGRRVR